MNEQTKNKLLSAIPNGIKPVDKKSSVEISNDNEKLGWSNVRPPKPVNPNKPLNKKDVIWHVKKLYMQEYGLQLHIPICAGYNQLATIAYQFYKQTGIEPTNEQLMDFFDWCFKTEVNNILQKDSNFSLFKLTKPKYILNYIKSNNIKVPQIEVESKTEEPEVKCLDISLEDVKIASQIGIKYLLETYGYLIALNYYINAKGKTKQDSEAHLAKHINLKNVDSVRRATEQFSSYPIWFEKSSFINNLNVEFVGTEKYAFLKGK
jgi:hypothetical protein